MEHDEGSRDRQPDFSDRIAVVTGAASGLGAALAHRFAELGMTVAALDIDGDGAGRTARTLGERFGVRSVASEIDVGDLGSIRRAADEVERSLGGCDLLCANVGVQQFGAIDRLTDDDWTWIVTVNVLGTVRTVSAFLPLLRRRSGWRRILITASTGALVPGQRLGAYQTTKFAVQGFGETLRLELAEEGIGVTVLFPGGMATRHLESSARARPPELGEWVLASDDIEVMLASSGTDPAEVVTPEHATRNVVADLVADAPYSVTHGSLGPAYRSRVAAMEDAVARMERS